MMLGSLEVVVVVEVLGDKTTLLTDDKAVVVVEGEGNSHACVAVTSKQQRGILVCFHIWITI